MLKKHRFVMILGWSLCLLGCQSQNADPPSDDPAGSGDSSSVATGKIGTINVAKIYGLMGLQQQRTAKQRELGIKLKAVDDEHKSMIKEKLTEFGGDAEKLTDEQKKELQRLNGEHVQAFQRAQAELRVRMEETNQYLNNVFMQQTREPIRKVAEARGLDAVMVLQPNMFAYIKPSADITDDVIKEIGIPLWKPEDAAKSSPSGVEAPTQGAITPTVDPSKGATTGTDGEPSDVLPKTTPDITPVEDDGEETSPPLSDNKTEDAKAPNSQPEQTPE